MMKDPRDWDVVIALVLALSATIYVTGLARLWRAAGRGRGVRPLAVVSFAAGLAALVVALLSPLDALSDVLFSAHMGQHELLMLVAAPLLVMGKPWLTGAWALPERWRGPVLRRLQRPALREPWRAISGPVVILVLHALALWIWHIPGLFEGAMRDERVHAIQHLSFFVTAALFWWALIRGRYGRAGYGAAALFVFLTAAHSGILGALITVAGRLWYPIYDARSRAAGVDPLADQQLAGLLMWIPAGMLLAALALGLLAAWLGEAERRVRRWTQPVAERSKTEAEDQLLT
jgi:putative membrane protein